MCAAAEMVGTSAGPAGSSIRVCLNYTPRASSRQTKIGVIVDVRGDHATSMPLEPASQLSSITSDARAARAAIEKPSYSGPAGRQSVLEKFQYLITRRNRRLTRLVDQVSGHHTMRSRDVSLEKWRQIVIRRAIRKHPANEAVAKRLLIGGEALRHAELVPL